MCWRAVIVDSPCKISVSGNYLILRSEEIKKIHLPEIYYMHKRLSGFIAE